MRPFEELNRLTTPGITPRPLTVTVNAKSTTIPFIHTPQLSKQVADEVGLESEKSIPGPFSSLESKSSWRPRQMPRKGRSLWMYSRSASAMPVLLRTSMAEPKAPTPGKTSRSAARMSSGLCTSRMPKPRWRMALRTLRTFPAP